MSSQTKFIKYFNDNYRESFNDKLFIKNEDDIVDEVQKVILSCQKLDGDYIIKVISFDIINDYSQIMNIMKKYESENKNKKTKKKVNQYEFINIKDTDYKLLIVHYYIRAKNIKNKDETEEQYLDVYIQIPKIVNKYYFKISGNLYSAIYQIVDGSTYNNSTSTNKIPKITLKTMFMPLKISRCVYQIKEIRNGNMEIISYDSYIFNKYFPAFKYILAKFGLYETLTFAKLNYITITNYDPQNNKMYTFTNNDIFINVPKYMFDNDYMTQALIYTIYQTINKMKYTKYEQLFTKQYWIQALGLEFGNSKFEKGESILQSFENIYDLKTKELIQLSLEEKNTIYCILRWMMREFNNLKNKNNLDISTKRVRYAEYLASIYAMKLSQGIYRLSDSNKVTLNTIRKSIVIRPSYLIDNIVRCNLVNYRNLVNDLDSITALKFSYKGISGMGEKSKTSVPIVYRFVDPSHIGRIDKDSSSKSDPGMTGILCPMSELYTKYNSFSEFEEPNTWNEEFTKTMNSYKSLVGLKEVLIFRKDILGEDTNKEINNIEENINIVKNLIKPIKRVEDNTLIKLLVRVAEQGGNIYYE